jgi:hypothetical protein
MCMEYASNQALGKSGYPPILHFQTPESDQRVMPYSDQGKPEISREKNLKEKVGPSDLNL